MTLQVTPLDEPLGAMVQGWEPATALSADDEAVIRDGLHQHAVLVFRGHDQPSDEQLVRLAETFGELVKGSEWFGDIAPKPEILRVNNLLDDDGVPQGTGASDSLEWHSDYSYVGTVGKESFLEAVEIPTIDPPKTYFCSQYDAFDRLDPAMVERLRTLRAHHSITNYAAGGRRTPREGDDFRDDFQAKRERNRNLGLSRPDIPEADHPVVLQHPDTGRDILYVSRGITRRIIGLPKDESDDLLKQLATHSTDSAYVYAHEWQVGDLVIFDTLGTLHRRDAWNPAERRVMRQMSTLWTPPANGAAG
ncbi:MAG: TauD/TfdA family dioxygenase [Rhodospirillaceae bacterium]|mgnify:CR=1 FL=1|jgi:alpha-ketoglutarate-dependent taurine dioxygenase|nr:TauD/TfdA family dioxygenase [Rhodospirillaceae bacterium]MBT5193900.1 TauD/TfdA family dioxygenase [Rhodospirillaceae bacterium]MBT5895632.1 TauD/TfdA family dioxygenase [Rhodospirillaceae bacterium]MBT6427460.1 TauD/TfdA family dioxygenase [Rhodospirillaceae bacterium]MBT6911168.1 TauD/TfdA family dioxygenase [Rhodospirillaceae bacterium]